MLTELMEDIHDKRAEFGDQGDCCIDYVKGANIAGLKKSQTPCSHTGWFNQIRRRI